MDTYNTIGRRTHKEDVLSIVKSSFMPVGIETDHYAVIGTITSYIETTNSYTNESIYLIDVESNDLTFTVAINKTIFWVNLLREEDSRVMCGFRGI